MPARKKRLLNWNTSALQSAVDFLTEEWDGKRPLDLEHLLVIVQTKGAGRRLRMALASHAHEAGQGIFPPRMVSPAYLIRPDASDGSVASDIVCLFHWTKVLKQVDLSTFSTLFPKPPINPDSGWRRSLAKTLHGLRKSLSEADLDFSGVAENPSMESFGETDRWRDLAQLEGFYRKSMKSGGFRDRFDVNRESAREPILPDGIERVLLLGVSGFSDLVALALKHLLERDVSVEVIAFGPEGEVFDDLFDEWGRPLHKAWEKRPMPLEDDHLFLFHDERAQAKAISQVLDLSPEISGRLALGIADPEIKPALERLSKEGKIACSVSDPEGLPATRTPLFSLLLSLADLLEDVSFRNAAVLFRCPEMWRWLEVRGLSMKPRQFLHDLDKLGNEHLPVTVENARDLSRGDLRDSLGMLLELVQSLASEGFAESLRHFLLEAVTGKELHTNDPADAGWLFLAEPISQTLDQLHDLGVVGREGFPLLLEVLRSQKIPLEADHAGLSLQGWLELAWEDAPRLLLAGFNDGCVPETLPGDGFLPENLRRSLGLWTSEDRFSRDAYLLQWILASRKDLGRVDVLLGKWRSSGDHLKPSGLLFLCDPSDEQALPSRVQKLFQDPVREEETPAWRFCWRLDPGSPVVPEKVSVTSFADFLACPYRFHLKKVLRMTAFAPAKAEADAMDFGSIVHKVLQEFGEDEGIRESDDESEIRRFLEEKLEEVFHNRFGSSPGLPLLEQKQSAWLRLSKAAEVQVAQRRLGWVPIHAEYSFERELEGILVRGKVDRVDQHEESGSLCVLDYKTSATLPGEAHWGPVSREPDAFPDYALLDITDDKGKSRQKTWRNLQLPLYLWWARGEKGLGEHDVTVEVGYFNLPADSNSIDITIWSELTEDCMESAMACAKGVLGDLRAGLACSPRPRVRFDDFEDLFFHDPTLAALPLGDFTKGASA